LDDGDCRGGVHPLMYTRLDDIELEEQRAVLRAAIETRKIDGCSKCGSHHDLQFHHIHKKSTEISKLVYYGASLKRLEQEMDKCIILCKECHDHVHEERRKQHGKG
jgi:5-methylcytosine-specific restriction endonuclease McrA